MSKNKNGGQEVPSKFHWKKNVRNFVGKFKYLRKKKGSGFYRKSKIISATNSSAASNSTPA